MNSGMNPYLTQKIMSASPEQLVCYIYDAGIVACKKKDTTKAGQAIRELINALIMILIFNIELKFFNNTQLITNIPLISLKELHFTNKFIVFIWTIFITVGIWRSAENYRGKFIWTVFTLIALSYKIFILKEIFY